MNNPYKELSPYLESDASRFKGRTVEIEEMYESFDRNEYFVCHADSGEGKSSIIEAGLIPKMKANCYFPIRVVFKSDEQHFKNGNIDFDDVICRIIDDEIAKFSDNKDIVVNKIYPNRLTNGDSTELHEWEKELIENNAWLKLRYTRITIDNLLYIPVLIFDQFEEVFTNPLSQEWTDCFFAWLQELSTDLCPQKIITEIEKHTDEDDFPEISTHKYFKAIFSLRSEYVGKLDYWGMQRHYIPLLKSNRYLLRPLTIKGAKEVITEQEGYNGLNDVADDIVDMLRKLQKGKNYVESGTSNLPCIPALLLSIVCSRAFNMSTEERSEFIQGLVANNDDEKEYAINALIAGFYEKAISECEIPSGDMAVIEDVLVNSEGNRQRVSSHADALKSIDFTGKYLKKMEKARLIRVIPEYNRDEESVEIVHDTLCPVILRKKEQRRQEAENKVKQETERVNKLKEQRDELIASFVNTSLAIVLSAFLSKLFHSIELVGNLKLFDTISILVLANFCIIPALIYSSIKKFKSTLWLSIYGIISNTIIMFYFLHGQEKEMGIRYGLAIVSLGIPLTTLIFALKVKLFREGLIQELKKITTSISVLLFFWIISCSVFYLCVFNKALGLPEPFNSSWGVIVIPLLTHEIIRNALRQRLNKIAIIVFCCLLGLLTYNTSVVSFALSFLALICILGMTIGVIIWAFSGLTWGKRIMAILIDALVLVLVVMLNMGFNVSKVKYNAVSHVFNWVDVVVHNQDNKVGVVSACNGDTILPCKFDSLDHRQHYAFLNSNKVHYTMDIMVYNGLYSYKQSIDSAQWQCLFIDEVENNISKYRYKTPDTLRKDSIQVYAAKVYHEVRDANINYFTSGKMYSLCDIASLDTLVKLQNQDLTDILEEISDSATTTYAKPLNISQVIDFNKAFARSFYLCMLKDRIIRKDSINIFCLTQEIITLYFSNAGNFELNKNPANNFNIGGYHKIFSPSFKASELRNNTLDSWYNYIMMLLAMDMGANAEDFVNKKVRHYTDILNDVQSIHDRQNQEFQRNKQRVSKILQKGDKLKPNDIQEFMSVYKKQLESVAEIKEQTQTQIDRIEVENRQMDLDFQKIINDVFTTLSTVVSNLQNIYNSEFVDICEQLYMISVLRQYEIAPIYLQYLEQMDNSKNKIYLEFKKMQEQEDSMIQEVKSSRSLFSI